MSRVNALLRVAGLSGLSVLLPKAITGFAIVFAPFFIGHVIGQRSNRACFDALLSGLIWSTAVVAAEAFFFVPVGDDEPAIGMALGIVSYSCVTAWAGGRLSRVGYGA